MSTGTTKTNQLIAFAQSKPRRRYTAYHDRMNRNMTLALPTSAVSVIAVAGPGIAYADRAIPQPGAPCSGSAESSSAMVGSQTFSPQGEVLLCAQGDGPVSVWQHLDGIQRPVGTWFTYGPDATLNADDGFVPGTYWVGFARNGKCTVVQSTATGAPVEQTSASELMDFKLIEDLATITFRGNCDWRTGWQRAPG